MIREVSGDILFADTEAIVNPVNTVGVMGAGLAAQVKCKYPTVFQEYKKACHKSELRVGSIMLHPIKGQPRYVISFPTKRHWSPPSRLEWIDQGLDSLRNSVVALLIPSIAIPPLGCGLGGLDWVDVRKLIEERLGDLDVDVVLYVPEPPGGDP